MVTVVMKACCILFGLDETWESAKRYLLGDIKFLEKLVEFDARGADQIRFDKYRKVYLIRNDFNRENIFKVS